MSGSARGWGCNSLGLLTQNVLHKLVEQVGNEKFAHIANTHDRNYAALANIESSINIGNHLGGPTREQIEGKIGEKKSEINNFESSLAQPGNGGKIHFSRPTSGVQANVTKQLNVLESTSGKNPGGAK